MYYEYSAWIDAKIEELIKGMSTDLQLALDSITPLFVLAVFRYKYGAEPSLAAFYPILSVLGLKAKIRAKSDLEGLEYTRTIARTELLLASALHFAPWFFSLLDEMFPPQDNNTHIKWEEHDGRILRLTIENGGKKVEIAKGMLIFRCSCGEQFGPTGVVRSYNALEKFLEKLEKHRNCR